jgi:regulator of sirC expression with transglutaminase-like and TPR domain
VDAGLIGEFKQAIAGSDEQVDLFNAAMVIARIGRPHVDAHGYARMLDLFAEDVRMRADGSADPHRLIQAIDHELFYVQGFHGNTSRYSDPDNSYLDRVIDRRTGIPITLSLVYMEVATRVGLRCDGVGYPGHFIVRCGDPEHGIFVDPFHQGAQLDREELLAGLRSWPLGATSAESFLSAITRRQFLQRMLNNLRGVFSETRDYQRWHAVLELLLCIEPWNAALLGERGMLRYGLGHNEAALEDLEAYASSEHADSNATALTMLDELRLKLRGSRGAR